LSGALRTIVFDVAQVLLGWSPRDMLRRLVPQLAPDDDAAAALELALFERWIGDWGEFDRGAIGIDGADGIVSRIVHRTGLERPDVERVVHAIPDELQPIHGTLSLVSRLAAAGHPVTYLSNMPAAYADILLARHGFFQRFQAGVFSAHVGCNKPEPAIYQVAQQRFGAPAAELVLIDDTLANVEAARRLGWQAVQFMDPAQAEAALQPLLAG
jgi:HAD superfamily hydrolase (TIGR01509 family)